MNADDPFKVDENEFDSVVKRNEKRKIWNKQSKTTLGDEVNKRRYEPSEQSFAMNEDESFEKNKKTISTFRSSTIADRPVKDSSSSPLLPQQICESVSALICHKDTETPLTIGVLGEWGSGKTSLMGMIGSKIKENVVSGDKVQLVGTPIWFDAWRHNDDKNFRQAFLWNIAAQLEEGLWWGKIFLRRFQYLLKKTQIPQAILFFSVAFLLTFLIVNGWNEDDYAKYLKSSFATWPLATLLILNPKAIPQLVKWVIRLVPAMHFSHLIGGQNWRGEVSNIDQLRYDINIMISSYLKKNERLVIFIDDLDRCSPRTVTQVLEAINVLVDFPRCIFVLGMDYEKVALIVGKKYQGAMSNGKQRPAEIGHHYLEKIIQLPIKLPPWNPSSIETFTSKLLKYESSTRAEHDAGSEDKEYVFKDVEYPSEWKKFLIAATSHLTAPTPRALKRFVAQANFFYLLCERLNDQRYSPYGFAYLMVTQREYRDVLEQSFAANMDEEELRQIIPELSKKIPKDISLNEHFSFLVLTAAEEGEELPKKIEKNVRDVKSQV